MVETLLEVLKGFDFCKIAPDLNYLRQVYGIEPITSAISEKKSGSHIDISFSGIFIKKKYELNKGKTTM